MTIVIVKSKGVVVGENVRVKMVEGAARLLAQRGLQATSFSEVLELTGAPRGSVYHHFPEGKDQMVALAIELAGARAIEYLERKAGSGAVEVTKFFLDIWREILVRSQFGAGCAVLAVTVASESHDLVQRTARVFRDWRSHLASMLAGGGLSVNEAPRCAALLVAACEGAVVLSRAEQSIEPFDSVAESLIDYVQGLAAKDSGAH